MTKPMYAESGARRSPLRIRRSVHRHAGRLSVLAGLVSCVGVARAEPAPTPVSCPNTKVAIDSLDAQGVKALDDACLRRMDTNAASYLLGRFENVLADRQRRALESRMADQHQDERPASTPSLCPTTSNCKSLSQCALSWAEDQRKEDVKAYACLALEANYTCYQATAKAQVPLMSADKEAVAEVFKHYQTDAVCEAPPPMTIQKGWFATALWVGEKDGAIQHGVQLMPSFSVGFPVVFFADGDAEKALKSVGAVGGAYLRYSPFGFWASVHGFFGVTSVSSKELDASVYTSPSMMIGGGGVDFLGVS